MAGVRHDPALKARVEHMRKKGKTYAEIQRQFPIPKSTLSVWLGKRYAGVFDRKAQLIHLKRIRILAAQARTKGRLERDIVYAMQGKKISKSLPLQNSDIQKSLLSMLYWAEGAKYAGVSGTKFVNTDPRLAKLYITLLRRCCIIDESKFRIRLYLHAYHNKKAALLFWSKLLAVPTKQFAKPYIKDRSAKRKFRRNFMGICSVNYLDSKVRKEILELGYAIHDKVIQ